MKGFWKFFLMIILAAAGMLPAQAQTKAEADSAYAAGRYDEAISGYSALLKKGESAEVYYNLGNCYYKTDHIAPAILNYERALLLAPGSSDVRFNLELARSKTIDKITPESEMFFVTWFRNMVDLTGMDGWARIGIVAFVLLCALVLLYLFSSKVSLKKTGFFGAVVMLLVVVLANVFAWMQHRDLNERSGAVVMDSSVVVKSTPDESGTDLFVLHEGTRVEIIDNSMKGWKEIRLADGKIGWMPAKAMEVI